MEKKINRVKGLPVMKREKEKEVNEIVVIDIRMKFWSMVWFMVKWAIAAIPAFIILSILIVLFPTILATITQVF